MNLIIVDTNELRVSNVPDDALVSYAVDSAVVVALYDPAIQIGGLLRVSEPDSRADVVRSKKMPARYADSGIAALLDEVARLGAAKPRLTVRLAGGAEISLSGSTADGKRNYLAVRKNLWKLGVFVQSEAVGGRTQRNVRLDIDTGRFWAAETPAEDAAKGATHCLIES